MTKTPIICLGDSMTAQNHVVSAGATYRFANGYMNMAQFYLNEGLLWKPPLNLGVNGDQTSNIISRLSGVASTAASAGAKGVVFLCGRNDINANVALSTIIANYTTIFTYIRETLNLDLFIISVIPCGTFNATQIGVAHGCNLFLKNYAATHQRTEFIDVYSQFGGGTDAALSGYLLADTIHPDVPGAWLIGKKLAEKLALYYGTASWDWNSPNLLVNQTLDGATGVNYTTGTVVTGNIPDNWYIYLPSTAACSVDFSRNADNSIRVYFKSVNDSANSVFAFAIIITGSYALTDTLQGMLDVNIVKTSRCRGISANMWEDATVDADHMGMSPLSYITTPASTHLPALGRGVIASDPIVPQASNTSFQLQVALTVDSSSGTTGEVIMDIYAAGIKKIT